MSEAVDIETGEVMAASNLAFSNNRNTILGKLFEAKRQIGLEALTKNAENDYHGSRYADINAVLERVEPVLMELGVMSLSSSHLELTNGVVTVTTELIHIESQESVKRSITFQPGKLDPQAVASCESYGRRYNHMGLFNLRSEDDDGNAGSGIQPGASKPGQKPSDKQLKFARELAAERGVEVPDEATTDGNKCSEFIDRMKADHSGNAKSGNAGSKSQGANKDKGGASGKANSGSSKGSGQTKKPSDKQLDFAGRLAAEAGVDLPEDAKASGSECSTFIDRMKAEGYTGKAAEGNSGLDESVLTSTGKQALDYIQGIADAQLGDCRKRVDDHEVLNENEKTYLRQVIDKRASN